MIGRIRQIAGASATRAGFSNASCSRISIDPVQATTLNVDLRVAGPFDRQEVLALLELVGLQALVPPQYFPSGYVVAHDLKSRELIGLAGLERQGNAGLLRVVAVRPSSRGAGLARALLLALMDLAGVIGIHELYVLSRIAPEAFAHLGWEKISFEDLPADLKVSDAVQQRGPSTANVLRWRVS
jgi:N-acetylglutamate synthase-like GNAT family acetyltransferase